MDGGDAVRVVVVGAGGGVGEGVDLVHKGAIEPRSGGVGDDAEVAGKEECPCSKGEVASSHESGDDDGKGLVGVDDAGRASRAACFVAVAGGADGVEGSALARETIGVWDGRRQVCHFWRRCWDSILFFLGM